MSLRREILRHFNYWLPVLGLEAWYVATRFDERQLEGYCIASPKYLRATVGFNMPRIRAALRKAKQETHWYDPLEELVLHEMVHIINPRASETSVSQMTLSLLRARALGSA